MSDPTGPTPPPPPSSLTPPPGYMPYGGPNQGAFGAFQRIGGVGKWLVILLYVLIPVELIAIATSIGSRSKARDFLDGKIDEDAFKKAVGLGALVGGLSFLLFIAAGVLTVIWMFRMAKNAQSMNRIGTWKPGWAIGGWFVPPFVLYIVPFLMFRDLWKASAADVEADWRASRVSPLVNVWWVLFGLAPVLFLSVTFANFQLGRNSTSAAKEISDHFGIQMASSLVQVAAAITYLLLVRQLTTRHKQAVNEA